MKKSESNLWKRIKLLKLKGQLFRIESNTINGIPDVYWLINGKSIWIELKSNDVKNLGLSKYQINWHLIYLHTTSLCVNFEIACEFFIVPITLYTCVNFEIACGFFLLCYLPLY